jgi:hypothetical protein
VQIVDSEKDSAVSEYLGPDIEKAITKEFTQRGIDLYIKVQDELIFSNKFSKKKTSKRALESSKNIFTKTSLVAPKVNYQDSIQVRISDDLRLKADGVVIFPHGFAGNTVCVTLYRSGSKTANTLISIFSMITGSAGTHLGGLTICVFLRQGQGQQTNIFCSIID